MRKMLIEDILGLPSVDSTMIMESGVYKEAINGTVDDALSMKYDDIADDTRYTDYLDRWRAHGQETPCHVFRASEEALNRYNVTMLPELAGELVFGNGHHRVAMAILLGETEILVTEDYQESYTDEDD